MLEQITTILLEKAAAEAAAAFRHSVQGEPKLAAAKLLSVIPTTKGALQHHLVSVRKWSAVVQFADLRQSKSVSDVYIELETYAVPASRHFSDNERTDTAPLFELLTRSPKHAILLGQPGAGKTTSLQKICVDYFSKGKILLNYQFPLLIRLRDIRPNHSGVDIGPLYQALQALLKISFSLPESSEPDHFIPAKIQAIETYLDTLGIAIILDGFDEIPNDTLKLKVLHDLRGLSLQLSNTKIILTCRTKEFPYEIENAETFEIKPLTDDQITEFSKRWLRSASGSALFLGKVRGSPFYDTAIRPLTLAHLCAIYERTGDIPDKPKTVYRKIVSLLLEEWDSQRSVRRTSAYSNFTTDVKLEFLSQLAYVLMAEFQASRFSRDELLRAYKIIFREFALPADQARQVTSEIESHTGLFVESGFGKYEFAHKSLQEYLAAEYLVRLPSLDIVIGGLEHMPGELAIAVTLSSRPTDFFSEIVLRWLQRTNILNPESYFRAFASRLALEQADLYQTLQSKLAACIVCVRAGRDVIGNGIVSKLIPLDSDTSLRHFYTVEFESERGLCLMKVKDDNKQLFPTRLLLPKQLDPQVKQALGI